MPFQPGDRLGAYEILSPLGAGGMGVVYRARDTRLGREVAIKTLPDEVAADPERRARFEREARALAALAHPNVASIFGFEQAGSAHLLVMELVEGETLADWIARGPIAVERALPLFLQIAGGLEAAHAKGIIHRDLKPANVKIAGSASTGSREMKPGAVKILDFGLAKALAPEPQANAQVVGASHSPTLTLQATMRGELLGTAGYMSPEQAEGEPADERADIWAFGVCLLEALTGRRVFNGANASRVLASVLKDEPDLASLPPTTPASLRRLLRRCLEKDRERRLHDIADARLELEEAIAKPAEEGEPSAARVRHPSRWLTAVVALGLVVLGGVGGMLFSARIRTAPPPPRVARFLVNEPGEHVAFTPGWDLAIAGDGTTVAYTVETPETGARTLRLRRFDRIESAPAGAGVAPGGPFFSPDNRWLGYHSVPDQTLRKVPIVGGPSVPICNTRGIAGGVSWGRDDTIVFGQIDGPLRRVAAAGGEPRDMTVLANGEPGHIWPAFLPDGRAVLFAARTGSEGRNAIHVFSLDTGERKLLVERGSQPSYAASGHLIYVVESTLYAIPFDARRLEIVGEAVPVLEGIATSALNVAKYALSASGELVYVTRGHQRNTLVWVDREGKEQPIAVPARNYAHPRLSPDGTRVAVDVREDEKDLWLWSLERGTMMRLTMSPGLDESPVWSLDGSSLFYSSNQKSFSRDIYRLHADGTGAPVRLTDQSKFLMPTAVTPAGDRLLALAGTHAIDLSEIVVIDAAGGSEPKHLLHGNFRDGSPDLSRDGRWLAYGSNESGVMEVYVRPFPAVDSALWQVSPAGGTRPLWSRDGKELFYLDDKGRLVAVSVVDRGASLAFGPPELVIETDDDLMNNPGRSYDVSPDGRRFLMVKSMTSEQEGDSVRIVLVQNWADELRRAAPAQR